MKKLAGLLIIVLVICFAAYELQASESEDVQRVMAFGDSLTYGKGDKDGEGYIEGLEDELNNPQSEQKVSFWNYGIKGQETDGVMKQLDDYRIKTKLDEADTFIVYIGTNDLINSNGGDLEKISDRKIIEGKREYISHLKKITSTLIEANDKADILVVGLYNPIKGNQKLEKHIRDYNLSIKGIADKDKRMLFIPTNDLFEDKKKTEYFSDKLHPNEKGYQLIANRVLESYDFK
ncbi:MULTISPECIES: GDSL-type esterase/lipase family protein [Peribacillus]|uniref:Spore germination lipase LipC n=1 Tax=Peribacillus simplex TaxID=1478 RepID=A0A9W4L0P6_9BACI|nr:GDSL-type esterase/lipase family protein [Peribacillus simplex]WHX92561.1 GDSL-type esterase/lipase family protein [Peribacillus simplex]CAH0232830.1 Spore germination lipase LipC [Peribacillus simplex]